MNKGNTIGIISVLFFVALGILIGVMQVKFVSTGEMPTYFITAILGSIGIFTLINFLLTKERIKYYKKHQIFTIIFVYIIYTIMYIIVAISLPILIDYGVSSDLAFSISNAAIIVFGISYMSGLILLDKYFPKLTSMNEEICTETEKHYD